MILGRIGATLEQMTLDMILLMKSLKLMGLNSVKELGNSTFGNRTRHALVMYYGIVQPTKKAKTTFRRSVLMISHQD